MLSIKGLKSRYGQVEALHGIDLHLNQGELVALVGANGAGKTTFLRALSGVQSISGGTILFSGMDITAMSPDNRVKQGITQVPEGRQVFAPMSVEDNLVLGGYSHGGGKATDLEKVYTMFPVLKEKRQQTAGNLSGGQQQMLAVGRALVAKPRLLLLDEPSLGLAPLLVQEILEVVATLRTEGLTTILVEQNAMQALRIADRGYVLETGKIVATGTGKDLLKDDAVRKAYLGG
ncbi:ABC transporter ATP-binding protein [Mesorhizobium sp. CAU 1741]|uniref:ABC transporter ATP-binding protein n=1 Tax=Mesorhizobium sp. CAU 1741 TaxID=3140366 RepID=UPI00325A732C